MKVTFRAAVVQILATLAISSLTCLTGMVFAWPSYNVANFVSNETVLSEPMSSIQVSLLGSLTNIGAFVMTPLCGVIANRFGRKNATIVSGIPYVIGWTILSISNSVVFVLIAMLIMGCGVAGQVTVCIYISEIADESIRGALMSSILSLYFVGLLLSYALGGQLTYTQIVYVQLSLALLYILGVICLKESPTYLLLKGKEKEAVQAIAFYKRVSSESKEVTLEVTKIKFQLYPKLMENHERCDDSIATMELMGNLKPEPNESPWQHLKKSSSSIRALVIALNCMAIVMLMGNVAVQVYAELLFKEAVPSLDANQCSIYLAMVLLLAAILCSLLIDRCGRKFLMISTCIGSSICTLILGTEIQFHWAPNWFTALLIYFYNFIFNMGAAIIPYVLASELFLPEMRDICSSIVLSMSWLLNFVVMIVFIPSVEYYGYPAVLYFFTIIGFSGALYSASFQPETKGLTPDAIQSLLLKNKNRNSGGIAV